MSSPQTGVVAAGVIAAGLGERMRRGATALKPLVPVDGRPLVEHVLASIAGTGAREVVLIINEASEAVRDFVDARAWPFAVDWIVETTPSSMHSFLRVLERLAERSVGPFLISTVDTVAPRGAFARFVAGAEEAADVTLALVDAAATDDRPLLVGLDGDRVTAIGNGAPGPYATAGYYLVRPTVLAEADAARRAGLAALRAFLRRLVECGYRVDGHIVAPSIDVDRPDDVRAAERLLRELR